ncbi:hypothetical protein [Vreelandella olivaria]|uniref:hypothetical protein n=1 Tax=Vreelandella olivaria TaxID=390919 RepID=UPI00201FACED|nr:hypothetical protein [Halomonas olivaria]
MHPITPHRKPKRRSYCLAIAIQLLNWWSALLCLTLFFAMGVGALYAVLQGTHSLGWSLLIAFIGGLLLHAVTIIAALSVAATTPVSHEPQHHHPNGPT